MDDKELQEIKVFWFDENGADDLLPDVFKDLALQEIQTLVAALEACQQQLAEAEAKKKLLVEALENHNDACGDALDGLWKDVILSAHSEYGDWSYPGEAYRHIKAEFDTLREQLAEAEAKSSMLETMMGAEKVDMKNALIQQERELVASQAEVERLQGTVSEIDALFWNVYLAPDDRDPKIAKILLEKGQRRDTAICHAPQ